MVRIRASLTRYGPRRPREGVSFGKCVSDVLAELPSSARPSLGSADFCAPPLIAVLVRPYPCCCCRGPSTSRRLGGCVVLYIKNDL